MMDRLATLILVGGLILAPLPPLTPPLCPHQNAQLRMPAVRQLFVWVEIEEAIRAALLALGHAAKDGVFGQVAQLERTRFINGCR